MIADKIENAHLYAPLSPAIAKGLELLKDPTLAEKEDGKYELDGDNMFYMIQRYPTKNKADARFEAHKNYIDIQAILEGQETIGCANTGDLTVTEPYKPDVMFMADPETFTELELPKGTFAIFFPADAHKPCYKSAGQSNILKAVIKIKLQ